MPVAVALVVVCGLVYATVQHDLRSNADDPQIQMAEDAATRLNGGEPARLVAGGPLVDVAHSLSPFTMIFDRTGKPIVSQARLENRVPVPPNGVLLSAVSGENRVTWQPESGVRIATVVVPFRGGYVLAGRSLRDVEQRENELLQLCVIACLVGLVGSAFAAVSAAVATSRSSR